ncbi:hypothetical protein PpBr36_08853 [Pyricularia pennisetigena]|uniref:hypothetical protein n=1 Tax=Pyricularia pennisetigena TaxID=1578925 RepID=UPI00114F87BB|nr:hypothetical protein PpBr36_08853 [Pyricularia pennisetigena]TLS24059.1 hypothetical protein PpBr36_08853 [Pyricularia pennisetigena]
MYFATYLIAMAMACPAVLAAPPNPNLPKVTTPPVGTSGHSLQVPSNERGPFTVGPGGNRDPLLKNVPTQSGKTRDEKPRNKLEYVNTPSTSRQDASSVRRLSISEQPKEGGLSSGTSRISNRVEAATGEKPRVYPVARGSTGSFITGTSTGTRSGSESPVADRTRSKKPSKKVRRSLVERRALAQRLVAA